MVLRWYYGDITVVLRYYCGVILERNISVILPYFFLNRFLTLVIDIRRGTGGKWNKLRFEITEFTELVVRLKSDIRGQINYWW